MEDPIIERTFEYSGNFENDYLDGCKFQCIHPFEISRVGSTHLSRTTSTAKLIKKSDAAIDGILSESNGSKLSHYESKFKFTKKINIFTDDDDEVVGLQIRGWRIPQVMMDILVNSILASPTVAVLNLWNCGLTDTQANALLQLANSNIRELFIDQNPGISDTLFSGFIGEESCIRTFSARSNSIGDAGAKAIAIALKVNRSLTILNLWDNRIRRDGAEAIAEGNPCLISLSLGKNYIDDSAVSAFGKVYTNILQKVLSNQVLSSDEVQIRRKVIAEWEKRRELEDKQRKGAAVAAAANISKTVGKGKDDPKKAPPSAAAKGAKKPENLKLPKSPEKKTIADDKVKARDAKKNSIVATPLKGQRKASIPEDLDSVPATFFQEPQPYPEPMHVINGQCLDFSSNEITEIGLNALSDAIHIQEITNEIAASSDGLNGIYRLSLYQNKFDISNPTATALEGLLKKRNPFYESMEGILKSEHSRLSDISADDRLKESTV